VFDGAESEKAGIDKGTLSATPSVNAIAIECRFVNANMLNSTSCGADIETHFTSTTKLHFRNRFVFKGTVDIQLPLPMRLA
jgi:hypothetical protein